MEALLQKILHLTGFNFEFLGKVISDTFTSEDSLISREGAEILSNKEDRLKIEDAVEELKKKKLDSKEVTLSDNRKIKVSIS